ncbi:putative acetyltransferase (plasmid) [Pseudosulfitobacter pseudonitzschiae]|uniref:Putative acetyltransferase n=1 Tax=Pseudosulfitobacter pseudonitzschiae TaxID=1402135 RepID=A0A221K8X8_9RHOB|nr:MULTISPECIES: GNAT family N-acetyltransferase [Roseobacteraceae]ASM75462.1 putative acetyltransferase [Pseudosulfitobacter pseudonitzschiae]
MRIRHALEADVPAIAQLARELASHVADPDPGADTDALLRLGFGGDRWFDCLLAEIGTEIVGFASYGKRFEIHTGSRRLWLGDLVVTQRCRNRGVGGALIAALRHKAVELGCDVIVLDLWAENASARAFYRKVGAVRDAELEVHLIPTGAD